MNIFKDLDPTLTESEKVNKRQASVRNFRSKSTSQPSPNSPFFSPLIFDPNVVGQKNCENLVGQISLPVGIAGPISTTIKTNNGRVKLKDLLIPLATTEGALVASINRGAKLLDMTGSVVTIKNVGMTRAPAFECQNIEQAASLVKWITNNLTDLAKIGESTSEHITYLDCRLFQKDNLVFARFAFDTDEAMGMNMVTIATAKIAGYILKKNEDVSCPALSGNVCADKKTSLLNRKLGRGRWVTVKASISSDLINSILKTTVKDLLSTYHAKIVVGSKLAGLSGANMHIANAASAILAATGQDIAHTVDISQGSLTLKVSKTGISAKLSLPTVPVGTVGGGTGLPAQTAARNLIYGGAVTSDILATSLALAALAGELSGLAALSTNTLASSHAKLAR